MISVKTFAVGYLSTNCYAVKDTATGKIAIVDPGYKSAELVEYITSQGAEKVEYILLTHGHFDHIWFALELKEMTGAKVIIGEFDAEFLFNSGLNLASQFRLPKFPSFTADLTLKDGEELNLGETKITFLHTPGHTRGSGCYVLFDDNVIFSGDTLFNCSMGRTDFITGSDSDMKASLKLLSELNGDFTVYPGHGLETNLEYERKNNPYM